MGYAVNLTDRAMRDLIRLFDDIHAEHSAAAERWYRGLKKAILTLEEKPNRCPVIPESAIARHLLYGRKPHVYRIIFRISEAHKRVDVLHIRHGVRRSSGVGDATLRTT